MAEIHLQRKRPGIWPATFALLAVVLIVWLVAATWSPGEEEVVNEAASAPPTAAVAPTTGTAPTPPPQVAAFLAFAAADAPAAGPEHDYTATGLRRLSAALDTVTREKQIDVENVGERLQAFRRTAEQIAASPEATEHSSQVREAFMSAADSLSAMQQNRWPDAADIRTSIAGVRSAADAIDADRPLLEQTPGVRQFFDRAATAVRKMAERM